MEWWIVVIWVLSPVILAAGSVAAAVVVAAGIRICARGTPLAHLTRRWCDDESLNPPRPAAVETSWGVKGREMNVVYCARAETSAGPLPRHRALCRAERPRCGKPDEGTALVVAGSRGRIVRQLCLTMTPIANIAAGILIANDRYAELPLPLLASVALALLIVILEDRDRARTTPVNDNRDAETPHPLLARKTC